LDISTFSAEMVAALPQCISAINEEHIAKELGDIAWYLAISADAIGYDLETIFQMNINKLKARYPDGFDSELSINRKTDDI